MKEEKESIGGGVFGRNPFLEEEEKDLEGMEESI